MMSDHRLRAALAAVEARYPTGPPTDEARERIAIKAGLPATLGKRLIGNTVDELTLSADELAAEVLAVSHDSDRPRDDPRETRAEVEAVVANIPRGDYAPKRQWSGPPRISGKAGGERESNSVEVQMILDQLPSIWR